MILSLLSLFGISFLAATLLPAQSEFALVGLIYAETAPLGLLVFAASLGNTLGSAVNWAIGRAVAQGRGKSWFPVSPEKLDRASEWYRRYGRWSLLLSWAPFIGDPLTLAAGVMREPFWRFLVVVAITKTGRYVVVAMIALGIF
ncbi:DedA family protein [Roseibium denhamense]|uniref:Membrane protein YqaA, SNARE-associated domain n=1 Tax=Roseibium denhamense TaxID=76305 RepID=A0ABY1NTJ4_9HYPH|nr:YqaA family protein [Roseibium denhamense]MTI05377.1 DedA family protein [Roseibium denhamense]SMP17477.1 membrane protein YqaA, SNARE-associated domain [Roseibium denhamense]